MSGRSVNLSTLFLGRLRPPKRLTSTSCTYFRQARPGIEPGPLTYESGAPPTALCSPVLKVSFENQKFLLKDRNLLSLGRANTKQPNEKKISVHQ